MAGADRSATMSDGLREGDTATRKCQLGTRTVAKSNPDVAHREEEQDGRDPSSQLQQLRARATRLLFSDRLNFLLALCHSSLAGEGAIELATFIADLLLDCDPTMARKFVQRVVRTKERIFVARDRKLEDILRDNSVSTMLITAYFRRVAGDFLTDTLQQPLIEVVEELRRQSLIGASPTTSPGSSPPRNMTEPQATGLGGPPSLLVTAAATTNGDTTTIDPTSVETAQLLTKKVHFAVQDLLEAIFRCQDHVPEKLREFAAMLRSEVDMFVMEMESTGNFRYSTAGDSAPASPAKDAVLLTKACAEGPVVLSTRNSNSPRSPRKSPGASGMLHGNSALRRSQVALADTPPEADETAIDAALSNMDIRTDVSVVSSRRASISEHIVGTLFFLRFFVPAIASPESVGIDKHALSADARKVLIRGAKLINGFFSEVDMRIKDPESAAVLDRFRERVQTFVRALSTVPNDDDDEDGCAKGRASTPSSMCIMDLDEKHPEMSERLIRYLARSLAKLDKDVAEYVLSVSNADSEGVHETLAELRRELEPLVADGSMSGSAHTIASSRGDVSDSGDISEGEDSSRRRSFKKRLGKAIRDMRFFFRAPAVSDTNLSGAAPTADKGGSSWSLGGRSRNNFG